MSTRQVCIGFVLLAAGGMLCAQSDSSSLMKFLSDQVNTHLAWGPHANSKGASLELEAKRVDESNFDVRLKAKGMSGSERYQLVSWPLNQRGPSVIAANVIVGVDGYVTCPNDQTKCLDAAPGTQVVLHLRPVPGEPTRLALLSKNREVKAVEKTTLLPLQSSDGSCDLKATLMLPDGVAILFEGSGFAPNEIVTESSSSGPETHSDPKQTDSAGRIYTVSLPAVKGQDNGELKMTFRTSRCAPTVTVPWKTN